jgi:hypothetical protein
MRGELSVRSQPITTNNCPLPLLLFSGIGTVAFIGFAIVLQHFGQLPLLIIEYNLM